SAGLEGVDDAVHGFGDVRQHRLDRTGNQRVLGVHGRQNLLGRHEVDLHRVGIAGLGDQMLQFRDQCAFCHHAITRETEGDAMNEYSMCQRNLEYCIPDCSEMCVKWGGGGMRSDPRVWQSRRAAMAGGSCLDPGQILGNIPESATSETGASMSVL